MQERKRKVLVNSALHKNYIPLQRKRQDDCEGQNCNDQIPVGQKRVLVDLEKPLQNCRDRITSDYRITHHAYAMKRLSIHIIYVFVLTYCKRDTQTA